MVDNNDIHHDEIHSQDFSFASPVAPSETKYLP